ncbi:MAG: hypothetical protein IJE23_06885 [Tyzzerella sp.]|nr:hypothetical protein [Tyzzerella sp.]
MKNKVLKNVRVIALSVAAVAMVVAGILGTGVGANAAKTTEQTDVVKYVEFTEDITSYLNDNTAPEYPTSEPIGYGYLFGGWYDKNGDVYTEIKDTTDLANKTGTVVAKFVPAQTLSVKCQNWAGTKEGDSDVIVRVISATDSTNYSNFGFIVSRIDEAGKETVLTQEPFTTTDVYSKFNYYKDAEATEPTATFEPDDLFGKAAKHFTTCTVGKIPATAHGTIICIKPFWVTLDGTTVYGLSKFAHVEDGYLGYVNVPVNLNILSADNASSAGILSVKSDDGLTFVGTDEIECGKVFDEMEFNVLSDGTIKCAGNTSDISEKSEMDIYINLKFLRKDIDTDAPIANEFYTFTVTGEDFCNEKEVFLEEMDVWNVIY